jgi:6-phosphogluconolactonase (cycloisomerase 2 family)
MKLKNIGRAALATVMSLGIAFGATACSRDYTVAYVYSTSKTLGTVSAYAVDYQSGALTQINGSPFMAGGTLTVPVAILPTPNGKFVYVLNNFSSNISVFAVGSDGKLYGQQTPSLTVGSFPTAGAIDSTGSFLYVTFTLQNGYTTANVGAKGGVAIFPINNNASSATYGQLGTPTYAPVGVAPVSVAVSQPFCSTAPLISANTACNGSTTSKYNVFVYVLDQETSSKSQLLGFAQNMVTGALTPLSKSPACSTTIGVLCTGIQVGVTPTAVAIEPTTRYVYVTDSTSNEIYGFQIDNNVSGNLTALVSSPYTTGQYPVNMVIDPRGKYILTANYNSNTISSLTINSADGSLGGVASAGAASVATGPTCVTIEPALGIYVYTSNSIDNSISAEKLDANTGQLQAIPNTPFTTSALPSCVTAVANGSHSQSVVNP